MELNIEKLKNSSVSELQEYVQEMYRVRGFNNSTIENALMLGEEVGELFKALREHSKMQIDSSSKTGSLRAELADVIMLTLAVANDLNINLEEAIIEKEKINMQRKWS